MTKVNFKSKVYDTEVRPTWCPGCGDFSIFEAIKSALFELNIKPSDSVVCYGIGCSGNMANNLNCYSFHSLHGRSLPAALGVKLANHKLKVLAIAGDGDCYSEGGNHFLHTARYNIDITLIVANNRSFSLTTGQSSPTSEKGLKTKTTLWGENKQPLNPMSLALSAGASFVGRSATFEFAHLKSVIKQAILHKGFSVVDVLQQCVYYREKSAKLHFKDLVYDLQESGHDYKNKIKAYERCLEHETDKYPIGVFYKENRPIYESSFSQIKKIPLVKNELKTKVLLNKLLSEFK